MIDKKQHRGFTMIELLVAATIISILAAVAISNYASGNKSARDARRKADLEQVRTALEMYRSQIGYYPNAGTGVWTDLSNLQATLSPDYIAQIPVDPLPSTSPTYKTYKYKATNATGSNYYGYCLEANLEGSTPVSNPCTPETGYNFGARHP